MPKENLTRVVIDFADAVTLNLYMSQRLFFAAFTTPNSLANLTKK